MYIFYIYHPGADVARLPDGTPISINGVNPTSESGCYVGNRLGAGGGAAGNLSMEYDGMTALLATDEVAVERGQELFIQIAIAGDRWPCRLGSRLSKQRKHAGRAPPLVNGSNELVHSRGEAVQAATSLARRTAHHLTCWPRPARSLAPQCTPHQLHHVTEDVGDAALDSAVFLKAGSLDISPTEITVVAAASKARSRAWEWGVSKRGGCRQGLYSEGGGPLHACLPVFEARSASHSTHTYRHASFDQKRFKANPYTLYLCTHAFLSHPTWLQRGLAADVQSADAGVVNWRTAVSCSEINGTDGAASGTATVLSPIAGTLANVTMDGGAAGACALGACSPALGESLVVGQLARCGFTCGAAADTVAPRAYVVLASSGDTIEVGCWRGFLDCAMRRVRGPRVSPHARMSLHTSCPQSLAGCVRGQARAVDSLAATRPRRFEPCSGEQLLAAGFNPHAQYPFLYPRLCL